MTLYHLFTTALFAIALATAVWAIVDAFTETDA